MDAKHSAGQSRCLISRAALLHNAGLVRRAVGPRVKIAAVIKANAYGHGAALVADTLANFSTDGTDEPAVDALAVADLDEAAVVGDAGLPVLVFRPVENAFLGAERSRLEAAVQDGWILTICSPAAADDLARIALAANRRANVQVMLDTGMNRAGTSAAAFVPLIEKIASHPSLKLVGVCTHFANSEVQNHPFNAEQLARFTAATDALCDASKPNRPLRSAANSGAIFFNAAAHFDLVRPGLSLYGIDPTCLPNQDRTLRPAMTWVAPLIGIRDVAAGETVGYSGTWTAPRQTRLGLLPVGYADGFARALSNKAVVLLNGHAAPVVGRVSMDLTVIDLTDVPTPLLGDDVTLLDSDPLSPASVYRHAQQTDTIPYEVFCRIGPRVRRVAVEIPGSDQRPSHPGDAVLDERA